MVPRGRRYLRNEALARVGLCLPAERGSPAAHVGASDPSLGWYQAPSSRGIPFRWWLGSSGPAAPLKILPNIAALSTPRRWIAALSGGVAARGDPETPLYDESGGSGATGPPTFFVSFGARRRLVRNSSAAEHETTPDTRCAWPR